MIAALRLRGKVKTPKKTEDTMQMLNLKKVHACTLLPETESYEGMLKKVKGYITWGEIDKETLINLLEKKSSIENAEEFAEEIIDEEDLPEKLEKSFGLHPPKGGFKGKKKKPYGKKGEIGYRGEEINKLLKKMI